jgi:hypothetical protein
VKFLISSWMVERWNLSFVSLLLSLILKSIRENMILWFPNIRHSGHSFCGSSPRHNNFFFSSYPLKAKYVELMGKEKGYNSSYVYWPSKRMVQKELRKLSQ